jgi:hypothetical protein
MLAVSSLASAVHAPRFASANITARVSRRVLRASSPVRASRSLQAFAAFCSRSTVRAQSPCCGRSPTVSPRKSGAALFSGHYWSPHGFLPRAASSTRSACVFVLAHVSSVRFWRSRSNRSVERDRQRATPAGSLRGFAAAAAPHLVSLGPCISKSHCCVLVFSRALSPGNRARRQISWLALGIACCAVHARRERFLSRRRSRGLRVRASREPAPHACVRQYRPVSQTPRGSSGITQCCLASSP